MLQLFYDPQGKVSTVYIKIDNYFAQVPYNLITKNINWNSIAYAPTRQSIQSAWNSWAAGKNLSLELADRPDLAAQPTPETTNQLFTTKTAACTLTESESFIAANASAGAFPITLPSAVGIASKSYTVKKIDATANTITINTTGSQTIDRAATFVLSAQDASNSFISNGTNWLVF